MSGMLLNLITVAVGAIVGTLVGELFNERLRDICFKAIGLAVLGMGVVMAYDGLTDLSKSSLASFAMVAFSVSMVLGALLGELMRIDVLLDRFGTFIERRVSRLFSKKKGAGQEGDSGQDSAQRFVEGFVSASVLFCVGTMAVLGSIQDGLGDPSTLYLKSVLDGCSAVILASTLGIGVGFSVVPLLIIQGGIALFAQVIEPYMTQAMLAGITGVGGVMLMAIATNMLGFKEIKVVNMLPALVIIALIGVFF